MLLCIKLLQQRNEWVVLLYIQFPQNEDTCLMSLIGEVSFMIVIESMSQWNFVKNLPIRRMSQCVFRSTCVNSTEHVHVTKTELV